MDEQIRLAQQMHTTPITNRIPHTCNGSGCTIATGANSEEALVQQIFELHLTPRTTLDADFALSRDIDYSSVRSVAEEVHVRLHQDATFEDLILLLRRWCLNGPYDACDTIQICPWRGKQIGISNTVVIDIMEVYEEDGQRPIRRDLEFWSVWKALAMAMKRTLIEYRDIVEMSPMYRYYGDLYPDNGCGAV